jgi:hypothetical protein
MKPRPQYLPPRSAVIFAVTQRYVHASAVSWELFAMEVAERYCATVAPSARTVPFRTWSPENGAEFEAAKKPNGQTLTRYVRGVVKVLPADLEDAWVSALPQPYRNEVERELASRRGHLAVHLPEGPGAPVSDVAAMTREFSELLGAIAPALADGAFTPDERALLARIVAEGDDLIAAVLGIRLQAASLMQTPAAVKP